MTNIIKTPFNWVGNKHKYLLDIIAAIDPEAKYDYIIDLFMGSGNILLNIHNQSQIYVGNDKIKLLPYIYRELTENKYIYTLDNVEYILQQFNRFSSKEDYYTFRDYWNAKYLNNVFDKDFILETVLLLKMCSNSMVRFNPKGGYFNQGFRGLGKKSEFFTVTMKQLCIDGLNTLTEYLSQHNYTFVNEEFQNLQLNPDQYKYLLILDPPYLLMNDMYTTEWSIEDDIKLFDYMQQDNVDYIYFNYLERDGVTHEKLQEFIDNNEVKMIEINNNTLSGQGRTSSKEIKEVMITNINVNTEN